jgi:RNA polymerase sigma factor (sigma-70 family)
MAVSTFPTTRRSVVLALRSEDADERSRAFDTLVAIYWKPLYKCARVVWSRSREDCEDLTQSFFATALEKDSLASYDASKASFRTFLRVLFERHAANQVKAAQRIKRGGGTAQLDFDEAEGEMQSDAGASLSPEEYFQREWVRSVFALAVQRVREQVPETHFALFEAYDVSDDRTVSYRELAERFSVPETTVTNHLASVRRQFRRIVLDTLREATTSDQEFRAEARALLGVDA